MGKLGAILVIVLHGGLILLLAVNLGLEAWFRWCAQDWGVTKIYRADDHDEDTDYDDAQDDCDNDLTKAILNAFCEDFCDNVDMASDAGKTVIAFFVLAIILCIVNILVAFCIGCKGKSSKLFLAIYPLQTVAVIVGVVAYAVVSDVNNYEDMEGVTADNNDYHDFEIKEGLGLAIANCLLSLIVLLISCLLGK